MSTYVHVERGQEGAPHKESISPQTRLIGFTTHAYSFHRLELLRSPHTPLSPDLIRATHARPLHPAAYASVPFGIVLVRVRVRSLLCTSVVFCLSQVGFDLVKILRNEYNNI